MIRRLRAAWALLLNAEQMISDLYELKVEINKLRARYAAEFIIRNFSQSVDSHTKPN